MDGLSLESNAEAFSHLQAFVNRLDRQLPVKVKYIRSDQEGSSQAEPPFNCTSASVYFIRPDPAIRPSSTVSSKASKGRPRRCLELWRIVLRSLANGIKLSATPGSYSIRPLRAAVVRPHGKPSLTGGQPSLDSIRELGEVCFVQVAAELRATRDAYTRAMS